MDKIKEALEEKKEIGFEITKPQKSFAGHTVYRLQLKVTYVSDTNITYYHFIGWKRYNDFKKLHKDLKAAFSDDIKLGFPVFPKGKIFGRFDESVIEERRQTCITFLQFILSNHKILFHQHVHNFINTNEIPGKEIDDTNPLMSYSSLMGDLVELPTNIENDMENPELFVDIDNEESEGDITLSFENTVDNRQTWLREARSICECDIDLDIPSSEEASVLLDEPLANDTAPSPSSNDGLELMDQTPEEIDEGDDSRENTKSMDSLTTSGGPSSTNNFSQKFIVDDKMSQKIEETVQQDDYIFHASVAMSNAIEQEELRNYDAAFDMYKFGIGLLLRGVQEERNLEKREAVRRKTAQYLMRAEDLYKSSLQTTENIKSRTFHVIGDSKWRFRLSDVKVFGIIKSVMLVQKVLSNEVYVMKVLHKKGAEYKSTFQQKRKQRTGRNLYNCRFMTKLINCVETQTGVYLLLEYVSGGRLWDYLNLPVFLCGHRHLSMIENHHSWSNTDFSNNANVDINDNHDDVIDIHCKSESKENPRNRISSVTCRLKRSLSQTDGYPENFIQLWAVQIALALMSLHNYGVICRDLNPKNIMIDNKGNIKLTYFSNVDGIDYTLDTDAVTYLYTSPEVGKVCEINKATDWWSYGAIIFELLMGQSLYSCHPDGIDSHSIITLPRRVSNEACSLLASFLQFNPRDRLGSGPHGSEEIKSHSFFDTIDWEQVNVNNNIGNYNLSNEVPSTLSKNLWE